MSYRFLGAEAGDNAGFSVSSAGDVNNDGLADLLIGATGEDGGGTNSGGAYLLYGADLALADAADGNTDGVIDLDNANETTAGGFAGYQFIGTEASDSAGRSVSAAGDVDGDGQADLLIGAFFADGGGANSGEAYLLYGADLAVADAADGNTDGVIDLDNANETTAGGFAGYQFIGTETSDSAGGFVSSAGDVDGDGQADLLIGASLADGGGSSSGEAYLLYGADLALADAADGSADGVIDLDNAKASDGAGGFAGYQFIGTEVDDQAGIFVSSAGDVDGDGQADMLIGAPLADGAGAKSGEAYLLYGADLALADAADGSTDGVIDLDNANETTAGGFAGYQFIGTEVDDQAGFSVSSAGDVDGDGRADLLIGAYLADGGAPNSGEAYLLYGADLAAADAADGSADGVIDLDNANASDGAGGFAGYQFIGTEASDWAGRSVSSAGDVDGDGQADLLIGANRADGGGDDSGEAYLLYGADLAAADAADGSTDGVIDLDNAKASDGAGGFAGYQFLGSGDGDRAGVAVSAAGDVDGDGQADLLIGAYFADGGGLNSGEAYLLYGAQLAALDAADGTTDGVVDLGNTEALLVAGTAGNDTIDASFTDVNGNQIDNATVDGTDADIIMAGAGNDTVAAGAGDDTVYGDAGDDTLAGGTGDDWLIGGDGADSLDGGDGADTFSFADGFGADTVSGGAGDDQIDLSLVTTNLTLSGSTITDGVNTVTFDTVESFTLGSGDDSATGSASAESLDGGAGNDNITAGDGADTLSGGDGTDTLIGDLGADSLVGGAGADSLDGGDGADTFSFADGFGADTVSGGAGDDQIDLSLVTTNLTLSGSTITDGVNTVTFDTVESFTLGSGDDSATLSASAESLDGGAGNDNITAGDGADTLSGGDGTDTLIGDLGADSLVGGAGADSLDGGADADTLSGGLGADSVYGGLGDDVFTVTTDYNDLIGDAIYGGDGNDTLAPGYSGGRLDVVYSGGDNTAGTLNFYDDALHTTLVGSTAFYGIESVTPCFTPGARVATPRGPVAVEDLRPGDQVLTRDNGAQPVAWVGCKTLPPEDLAAQARLRPVLIRAGALGHGLPERDMMFSPNHQILRADPRADLYFGEHEVLLAAKHLVGRPGITRALPKAGIAYVHFMFERHEVVLADGVWSESFQPGDQSLAGLDDDQRDELLTLFPALATQHGTAHYPAARRILRRYEARALLG